MLLFLALTVALGWAWVETFYSGVSVNAQLSYKSFDAVGGIPFLRASPIIGHHYFGDFQVPLGYAAGLRHSMSPYLRPGPEQYPPFTQALFVPLSFLSLHTAAFVYLALSAVVFLVPLWLLLGPLEVECRVMLMLPIAVLTLPFVSFLDRGNDIGIAVGLVAWAVWAWKSERGILCAVCLAVAIALKAYPAVVLVVPLALRRYKFTTAVAASAGALNLLLLAFYPGGFVRNLRAVLPALRGAPSALDQLHSWSLYSVVPKTAGLLFGPTAADSWLAHTGFVTWLPSVLYLCGVYLVINRGRVPQWCWGPLGLAAIQLCVPVNFMYTTAWAPLAAVWYAWGHMVDRRSDAADARDASSDVTLRVLLLLALTATLTPSVFTISGSGGFETPLTQYLSPLLIFVTLCAAIFYSLRPGSVEIDLRAAERPVSTDEIAEIVSVAAPINAT